MLQCSTVLHSALQGRAVRSSPDRVTAQQCSKLGTELGTKTPSFSHPAPAVEAELSRFHRPERFDGNALQIGLPDVVEARAAFTAQQQVSSTHCKRPRGRGYGTQPQRKRTTDITLSLVRVDDATHISCGRVFKQVNGSLMRRQVSRQNSP